MFKFIRREQRGFTLIELIVVIAIMGVLAAVTAPTITNHLGKSREQSYVAEKERIQSAIDGFVGAADNERFLGLRQFPMIGSAQTDESTLVLLSASTTPLTDQGNPFNLGEDITGDNVNDLAVLNRVGGTQGVDVDQSWIDGGADGVRQEASGSPDKWTTVAVTRGGIISFTDPRYFFIDFEKIVKAGLLQEIPDSVAPDNKPVGSTVTDRYNGSYIWYVDAKGEVKSLYIELPSTTGFINGVFP